MLVLESLTHEQGNRDFWTVHQSTTYHKCEVGVSDSWIGLREWRKLLRVPFGDDLDISHASNIKANRFLDEKVKESFTHHH
ncbi:hypothetical protein [Calothrix sp. NIES-2100]|uniref:hypothetical protein n=1 Tax=Calothrix sp. NIES-2100 TaxID=1954172 RepID=UPI0030DACBB7